MNLEPYFQNLIDRLNSTEDVTNAGKDSGGFFEPTRAVLLQKLSILRDLHAKPNAKPMVRQAWEYVIHNLPPEWLILDADQKVAIKKMLA